MTYLVHVASTFKTEVTTYKFSHTAGIYIINPGIYNNAINIFHHCYMLTVSLQKVIHETEIISYYFEASK